MRIRLNHKRLLEIIQASRISQNHWAMRLGLSRGHWSNIVQGKHPYPSGKTRERLLDVFDVPFEDLFAYESTSGAQASFQAAIADRYLIDREIGQGGMGTVYLARDVRLARPVALKVVAEEAVSGIGAKQFLREIRYTARLRHHHILPLYDAGEAAGVPYYVMPYLEDGSLPSLLKPGRPLDLDEALPVIRGIAAALQYAHERQVLHCDVKPENILISEGHVYVADFGIARAIHAETREWGRRGDIDSSAGTPAYVSPEQAAGELQLDARSDIYSLGCIAYEILSGAPPFEGSKTMEIVSKRFVEKPSLRKTAPQVSSELAECVHTAMALERDDRFASAGEFAQRINTATVTPSSASNRLMLRTAQLFGPALSRIRSQKFTRGNTVMDQIGMDVRYAFRTLRKNPLLAFVTTLTLALGIGANTAIFSAVNGILLKPLPFRDANQVVVVREVDANGARLQVSPPNLRDWRETTQVFTALSFSQFYGWQTVVGGVNPVRATVERVGRDFFTVFDVAPALGRVFSPTENQIGGSPVIVVSHSFWLNDLGGDSDLTAQQLDVGEASYQVIGVMPPDFRFQGDPDIWIPAERFELATSRTTYALRVVGRLSAGETIVDAQRELETILAGIREQAPETSPSVDIRTLQEDLVGNTRSPLYLLTGSAILLLVIACTNVASTLLARGERRHRELAMRAALGAQRARIIRQLLTESFVIATLGAIAGVVIAGILITAFTSLASSSLVRVENISIDVGVMVFTASVTLFTALLCGLWPAFRGTQNTGTTTLREGTSGATKRQRITWFAMVTTQIAVAFVLVVGATLLIRSFWNLTKVDAGFDPSGLLTVEYALPEAKYPLENVADFHERFVTDIAAIPGVTAVGLVNHVPLGGESMFAGVRRDDSQDWFRGDYRLASPGFFAAMGTHLIRGREFVSTDGPGPVHVTVINERLAELLWPDENAIGKRIMLGGNDLQWETPLEVVGVVPAVRHGRLTSLEPPTYYVHYRQRPMQGKKVVAAIRTSGDPQTLVRTVTDRLRMIDRDVPAEFATMSSRVSESVANERFTVIVLTSFTVVALGLAMVGIFGVVSYTVARRTREIGIRIALGAVASEVRNMILRESLATVLLGVAVGSVGSLYLARFIRGILFEVDSFNVLYFFSAATLLCLTALFATWIPARRGMHVDATIAIRAE